MLIAPTEPPSLRAIGRTAILPEKFGADILIPLGQSFAGIQRKTVADLLASVEDGRLVKERQQMRQLSIAMFIIEGRPSFSNDGRVLIVNRRATSWTRPSFRNLLRSIQRDGIWVEATDTLSDTIDAVREFEEWVTKPETPHRRLSPVSAWGKLDNDDWARWLLQGLEGIGPKTADSIIKTFGGVPMMWTVTEKDLSTVPGVGKKRAKQMVAALCRAT